MIALAMIIKDDSEAPKLKRCLESVYKYVDGIYITGTNKPDHKIKKIAAKYNANYSFFKWTKNFAEARNFNFAQVPEKYEYILWLDADDQVINPQNLKEIVKSEADIIDLPYIYAKDKYGNVVARQKRARILKRVGEWKQPVHEHYVESQPVKRLYSDKVIIEHDKITGESDASTTRNIDILLSDYLKDKENPEPRTLVGLGNAFYALQKFEEAIEFFLKYIKVSGWDEEKYLAIARCSQCLNWLGNQKEAIDLALKGIQLRPDWSLCYFNVGEFYLAQGNYRKAIDWLLTGFTKKTPETVLVTNDLDYTINPMGRLAYAYLYTNQIDKALEIVSRMPDMPEIGELRGLIYEANAVEGFVRHFLDVVGQIYSKDQKKAEGLFDCLPVGLEEDVRILEARNNICSPKKHEGITYLCGKSPEIWADPSIITGLGGSETAVVQLAREFNKLGHKVEVYNNSADLEGTYNGVEYKSFWKFNQNDEFDTLIVWRNPDVFQFPIKAKTKILDLHDVPNPNKYNPEMLKNLDYIFVKSEFHKSLLPDFAKTKAVIIGNGTKIQNIPSVERKKSKLGYFSSYDRGLIHLLENWQEIKKAVPETTLEIAYGWDTYNKMNGDPKWKEYINSLMNQEGITHHGRISKKELYKLMSQCEIWSYPCHFEEIDCIVAREAQTLGCYPVVTNYAALKETVKFGDKVEIDVKGDNWKTYINQLIKRLKAPGKIAKVNFDYSERAKEWLEKIK